MHNTTLDKDRRGQNTLLNKKNIGVIASIFCFFIFIVILSLYIGRYPLDSWTVCKILFSKVFPIQHTWLITDEYVIFMIRLPRAIAVILVGIALSCSGSAFQSTFRNPIVSEQILGTASAAGFGAAIGLLIGLPLYYVEIVSFCFGFFSVGLVIAISKSVRTDQTWILVLAGVIIGSLFSSLTSFIKFIADPQDKLPSIVFWLMGSFSRISIGDIYYIAPIILFGFVGLMLVRWRLNIFFLSEEEIKTLGVNITQFRFIIIFLSTMMTAAAVCISGVIGWVGLIIPHISRMLIGSDHRLLIPISAITGASYLLFIDLLCRNLTASEIPIGIITSIIGLPIFLYLVKKTRGVW